MWVAWLIAGVGVSATVASLIYTRRISQRHRARLAGIETELAVFREREDGYIRSYRVVADRLHGVLSEESIAIVFQPIVDLSTGTVAGHEALSRFESILPVELFEDARRLGVSAELEMLAARCALREASRFSTGYIAVNLSARTLASWASIIGQIADLSIGSRRLVIELSEKEVVDDYPSVRDAVEEMRPLGIKLAIDDLGAGFSSLAHLVELEPDIVKLDGSIVASLDSDIRRQALMRSLRVLSDEIGASLVAEGVESVPQLEALAAASVRFGQGFLLAKPAPALELDARSQVSMRVLDEVRALAKKL